MIVPRHIFATCLVALSGMAHADSGRERVAVRLDSAVEAVTGKPLAPPTDDAAFQRRLWLDLAGRVPPAHEARAFLADASPNKRADLIKRLLQSDDFADHWGGILTIWLTGERP